MSYIPYMVKKEEIASSLGKPSRNDEILHAKKNPDNLRYRDLIYSVKKN